MENHTTREEVDASTLTGTVAVVTGASGALGHAITETFCRRGADVLPVDINGDAAHFDVGSIEGCRGMIDEAISRFGRLDVLVLNAGIQHVAPIDRFPIEQWDKLFDLYLRGPMIAIQAAWPHLVRSGRGRIIATSSTSSFQAEPYKAAYIAARHGLLGLLKVAALEGAEHGLTANSVAPAWMDTAAMRSQLAEQSRLRGVTEQQVADSFLARQPVKRFIDPRKVAEAFAFLASEAASPITGACLPVDHGTLSW